MLFSCKKYKVEKVAPSMIGDWYHYTGIGYFFSIGIFESGRGNVWEKNEANNGRDSHMRAWLVKENNLIFSRLKEYTFHIDKYPTLADSLIINGFDTISAGRYYMILDGKYFRKN